MELREGEQLDDLQYDGLKILQKKDAFRYGTDGVLLANYAAKGIFESRLLQKRKDAMPIRMLDIGTGCGIIPILLCGKLHADAQTVQLRGAEIQVDVAEMARRSVLLNGQEAQISIDIGDVRTLPYESASFDVITMNPPYVRKNAGLLSDSVAVATACHECVCTQEELIARAAALLRPRGLFYMINKPDRLTDALSAMRENRLEPWEIRFVQSRADTAPVLFLVYGVRCGGKGLRVPAPILLERGTEECFI